MSVTETSSEGWLSRIGGAIKGVLVGLVMFIVAFPVLWWNEGRAVDTALTIDTVEKEAVTVPADPVDATKDGKLVHTTGTATTTETLADPACGVSVQGAIRLVRQVEMYQWKEKKDSKTEKNVGGGSTTKTTYTYSMEWNDDPIDSSDFKEKGHDNPSGAAWPIKGQVWEAKQVTLGGYTLTSELVGQIRANDPIKPGAVPAAIGGKAPKVAGDQLYLANDTNAPVVGDVRIGFKAAKPQPVAVVALQQGKTFATWMSPTKQEVQWLYQGALTLAQVVEAKRTENTIMTWVFRALGFFLMAIGLSLVFKPLSVVADVLPFFGDLVGMGFGLVAFGMAFVFSFLTIGIAWIAHRPLVGIPLVVGGVALFVMLVVKSKGAKKVAPAT